jgi:integrase
MGTIVKQVSKTAKSGYTFKAKVRMKGINETRTFTTKAEADAWVNEREGKIRAGTAVNRSEIALRRTVFADLLESYLREVISLKRRKAEDDDRARRILEKKYQPAAGVDALREWPEEALEIHLRYDSDACRVRKFLRDETDLTGMSLELLCAKVSTVADRWLAQRLNDEDDDGDPVSPGTVRRELIIFKSVIDHAMRNRRDLDIPINPFSRDRLKWPSIDDQRDRRLTHEEWDRLLEAMEYKKGEGHGGKGGVREESEWIRDAVELLLETGMRRSSLLRLRWSDIDVQNRTIHLKDVKNSRKPNSQKNIKIGMTKRSAEIFDRMRAEKKNIGLFDPIFEFRGDSVTNAFCRACSRAGIENFRLHDVRHETASRLVEAGWSQAELMAQMGWSDPKSAARYYNADAQRLAEKMDKIDAPRGVRNRVESNVIPLGRNKA